MSLPSVGSAAPGFVRLRICAKAAFQSRYQTHADEGGKKITIEFHCCVPDLPEAGSVPGLKVMLGSLSKKNAGRKVSSRQMAGSNA